MRLLSKTLSTLQGFAPLSDGRICLQSAPYGGQVHLRTRTVVMKFRSTPCEIVSDKLDCMYLMKLSGDSASSGAKCIHLVRRKKALGNRLASTFLNVSPYKEWMHCLLGICSPVRQILIWVKNRS